MINADKRLHKTPDAVGPIDWGSKALWGIGQFTVDDMIMDYPISYRDHYHDKEWFKSQLEALGVGHQSLLLQCGNTIDWQYTAAVQRSCQELSITWAPVMAKAHDAPRLEMFLRRFRFDIVMGVNELLLDGIESLGMALNKVFFRSNIIFATPGARRRLENAGVSAGSLYQLGPLTALGFPGESTARFDHEAWSVESINGALHVTSGAERACCLTHMNVGKQGKMQLDEQGNDVISIVG